jgi:hypothetical protein
LPVSTKGISLFQWARSPGGDSFWAGSSAIRHRTLGVARGQAALLELIAKTPAHSEQGYLMWQWWSWSLPVITHAFDAARREFSQVRATHTGSRATRPNKAFQKFLVEIEQLPHASNDSFYFLIEAYAMREESAVEQNLSFGRMDNLESPIQKAAKCDHKQRRFSNELTLSNFLKQWLSLTLLECYLLQGFCSEFFGEIKPQRREFIVVERNLVIAHHWAPVEVFGGNVQHRSSQSRPDRYESPRYVLPRPDRPQWGRRMQVQNRCMWSQDMRYDPHVASQNNNPTAMLLDMLHYASIVHSTLVFLLIFLTEILVTRWITRGTGRVGNGLDVDGWKVHVFNIGMSAKTLDWFNVVACFGRVCVGRADNHRWLDVCLDNIL